jgi:hypothetical protein
MAPSREVPTKSSSYTPTGDGERGMADIFAPTEEPKSELANYRLLAPKCGCEFTLECLNTGQGADSQCEYHLFVSELCQSEINGKGSWGTV